jgi:predicted RND superfamily exporter protein
MREKILKKLAHWHASHPWRMLAIVILITIILAGLAGQMRILWRWSDMLPTGDKRSEQFNKIIEEFTTSTSLVVVVQGEEERIKEFADQLAPRILEAIDSSKNDSNQKKIDRITEKIEKLKAKTSKKSEIEKLQSEIRSLQDRMNKKLFQRVDYKAEIDYLKNHALMLVKEDDLKNLKDVFMDPNITGLLFNINNSMEKEYVGQEESLSTREKEDGAVGFLDGIQNLVLILQKAARGEDISEKEAQAVADKFLFGEPYFLSYDKKALLLNAIPNFSLIDQGLIVIAADAVQAIVDDLLKDFPNVKAGLTGLIATERDENVYAARSLSYSTLIALVVILILLMISFRMWVAPIFAVLNLIVGLIWAVGITYIVVGHLNLMTVMMSVILLGLGVDFSIHLISGFTERRSAGDSIAAAMEKTFVKSGKGIVTGAVTTAFAFMALVISHSRGMKEMGLVIGTGLLAVLLTTMLLLPAMLVFRERRVDRKHEKKAKKFVQRDISFRFLGRTGEWLSKRYIFTIIASLVISALLIWSALKIKFDHNYWNMEPKGLTSIALIDTVLEKFDLSMDYALILTDDVEESRELSKQFRDLGSVARTNDISLYLPSPEQQQKRIPHLNDIRKRMQSSLTQDRILPSEFPVFHQEIERLEMNIMEMQDMAFIGGQDKVDNKCKEIVGNPDRPDSQNMIQDLLQIMNANEKNVSEGLSEFQQKFAPYFKESVIRMGSIDPIRRNELPVTILDSYSNKTRDQFLITVYPAANLWADAKLLNRFVDDLERVSDKATGVPPVFRALLQIIGRDGRNAALLTLVVVFLLLCLDFFNPRQALMAMVPLALGVFWMVGSMSLLGMKLTIMNIMCLPIIIGIGIDDGVHIIHRWRYEGDSKIRTVFSSTGKAIFLTSLTTMLAFGSMVFSVFRGFVSFGGAMFLGVGACFLTTVIILPGIFGLIRRRNSKKKN